MVKKTSYVFVALLITIVLFSGATIIFKSSSWLVKAININALLLLICGIVLIVTLIHDRYKDLKNEDDDYKNY